MNHDTGLRLAVNNPRNEATCQFREQGTRLVPLNEAAETICDLVGLPVLPRHKLEHVRKLGFAVEIRP